MILIFDKVSIKSNSVKIKALESLKYLIHLVFYFLFV